MRSRLFRLAPFVLFSVSAWCVFPGVAAGARKAPAPAAHPALASAYRGSAQRVLARAAWGNLTESDLYLFLLVSGIDSPLLFQKYEQASDEAQRAELRERVEKAIQAWAMTRMLASEASSPATDRLGRARLRMLTYPVHQLVWIDRCLQPRVVVADEDVQKYYSEHSGVSFSPRLARVRCIFKKVDPKATREEWENTRRELVEIRDLAVTRQEDFADLARKHSQASNAPQGGEIRPFKAGTYFAAFEKAAFTLEAGEIPMPVRGKKGLYLLQGLGSPPREVVSARKAEPEIKKLLRLQQLRKRYEFALAELAGPQTIENRGREIDLLDWDAWAMKAGRLRLTKNEVWDLFPEFVGPDFSLNKELLARRIQDTAEKELIARFNEKRGWTSQPALVAGQRMASDVARAIDRLDALAAPDLRMTPAEIYATVRENPSDFGAVVSPRFSVIRVQLLGGDPSPAQRELRMKRLRETVEAARDRIATTSLESLAAQWPVRQADPWRLAPTTVAHAICRCADPSHEVSLWTSDQPLKALDPETRKVARQVAAALGIDTENKASSAKTDTAETAFVESAPETPDTEEAASPVETSLDEASSDEGSPDEGSPDETSTETAKRNATRDVARQAVSRGDRFLPLVEGAGSYSLFYIEQPDFRSDAVLELARFHLHSIAAGRVRVRRTEEIRADRVARARLEILVP